LRQSAEGRSCRKLFLVEHDILDEVGLVEIAQLELHDRPIQLIDHGFENRIRGDGGVSRLSGRDN